MSRVLFQIGFVKNRKMTQSINGYINDEKVSWTDQCGTWLTSQKDRNWRGMSWFMYEAFLEKDDVLKIEVSTYLQGIGKDEERSFESLYYVEDTAPIRSVDSSGVGCSGYPLLKGKVLEIASISDLDKRKAEIEDFLNNFDEEV